MGVRSVDVAVVAMLVLEFAARTHAAALGLELPLLFDDAVQRSVDVFRHAGGIAADIDAGAVLRATAKDCAPCSSILSCT